MLYKFDIVILLCIIFRYYNVYIEFSVEMKAQKMEKCFSVYYPSNSRYDKSLFGDQLDRFPTN